MFDFRGGAAGGSHSFNKIPGASMDVAPLCPAGTGNDIVNTEQIRGV